MYEIVCKGNELAGDCRLQMAIDGPRSAPDGLVMMAICSELWS